MSKIQQKHILKCIPLLASILGDKYGINVEISGEKAMTNGNTIILPNLPQNCTEEFIGLLRGYVDHEAAHIRYTDFELLKNAQLSTFENFVWNSIEDWRVEQKIAQYFEGCKANFQWLIRHIFYTEKKPKKMKVEDALASWILLSIRAWDLDTLQTQINHLEKQINKECPRLLTELGLLLDVVKKNCENSLHALNHARAIVDCITKYIKQLEQDETLQNEEKKYEQKLESNPIESQGESKNKSNIPQEDKAQDTGEEEASKGNGETFTDPISASKTQMSAVSTTKVDDTATSLWNLLNGGNSSHLNALENKAKVLIEQGQERNPERSIRVAQIGTKRAQPLENMAIQRALKTSAGLKARLQGLLQAQALVRQSPASQGKINKNRLHALAVHDKRIFLQQTKKEATNTAIHILLDCSGSMTGRIGTANEACFALACSLSQTKGINIGVTAFPASNIHGTFPMFSKAVFVAPILKHGEKVHTNFHLKAEGGTPLTEALWWVLPQILKQKECRKIILLITDGEPDDKDSALHAIETVHRFGVEIYGISLSPCNLESLLPSKSITINHVSELTQSMFGLLQNTLVKDVY